MVRRLGVLAVVLVAATVLAAVPAAAQDAAWSDAAASTVRIQARLLESGKVEFGLQLDGDRTWLPRARLFPYRTAEVGTWLFASPYTLSDGTTVRIQARLLESGKVEFGLQFDGDRTWLPRARLFPYQTAEVGSWLFASPYAVSDAAAPIVDQDDQQDDGSDEAPPTTTTIIDQPSTDEPSVKPMDMAFWEEQDRLYALRLECDFNVLREECMNGDSAMTHAIIQGYNDSHGCEYEIMTQRCPGQSRHEANLMIVALLCGGTNWRLDQQTDLCHRLDS